MFGSEVDLGFGLRITQERSEGLERNPKIMQTELTEDGLVFWGKVGRGDELVKEITCGFVGKLVGDDFFINFVDERAVELFGRGRRLRGVQDKPCVEGLWAGVGKIQEAGEVGCGEMIVGDAGFGGSVEVGARVSVMCSPSERESLDFLMIGEVASAVLDGLSGFWQVW